MRQCCLVKRVSTRHEDAECDREFECGVCSVSVDRGALEVELVGLGVLARPQKQQARRRRRTNGDECTRLENRRADIEATDQARSKPLILGHRALTSHSLETH